MPRTMGTYGRKVILPEERGGCLGKLCTLPEKLSETWKQVKEMTGCSFSAVPSLTSD